MTRTVESKRPSALGTSSLSQKRHLQWVSVAYTIDNEPAIGYLKGRGLTGQTAVDFGVGFAQR